MPFPTLPWTATKPLDIVRPSFLYLTVKKICDNRSIVMRKSTAGANILVEKLVTSVLCNWTNWSKIRYEWFYIRQKGTKYLQATLQKESEAELSEIGASASSHYMNKWSMVGKAKSAVFPSMGEQERAAISNLFEDIACLSSTYAADFCKLDQWHKHGTRDALNERWISQSANRPTVCEEIIIINKPTMMCAHQTT